MSEDRFGFPNFFCFKGKWKLVYCEKWLRGQIGYEVGCREGIVKSQVECQDGWLIGKKKTYLFLTAGADVLLHRIHKVKKEFFLFFWERTPF